jgi:hypothetical protein
MRGHHPIRTQENFALVPRVRDMCETAQKIQKITFVFKTNPVKIYIIHMYLLVEGSKLFSQDNESIGKDEGEVKSTPSIILNQEVATT